MIKNYCPIIAKDLPSEELDEAFPWTAGSACQDYYNVEKVAGEGVVIDNNWSDLINSAGQEVGYYIYKFDKNRDKTTLTDTKEKLYKPSFIFGEDVLAEYDEPFIIKAYLDIKDMQKSISQYGGFYADDTVTMYIHIKTFKTLTANKTCYEELDFPREPHAKDLIEIISYGCDRPNGRGANLYEITNKEDQLFSDKLNPYFSHYVWKITAKRYIFSNEGGIEPNGELVNEQLFDNKDAGTIMPDVEKPDKLYDFNNDEISKKVIFDQSVNAEDEEYGGYYV